MDLLRNIVGNAGQKGIVVFFLKFGINIDQFRFGRFLYIGHDHMTATLFQLWTEKLRVLTIHIFTHIFRCGIL